MKQWCPLYVFLYSYVIQGMHASYVFASEIWGVQIQSGCKTARFIPPYSDFFHGRILSFQAYKNTFKNAYDWHVKHWIQRTLAVSYSFFRVTHNKYPMAWPPIGCLYESENFPAFHTAAVCVILSFPWSQYIENQSVRFQEWKYHTRWRVLLMVESIIK